MCVVRVCDLSAEMDNYAGKTNPPANSLKFKVRSINDKHVQVHKGVIEVTPNSLIYTDSHSAEGWRKRW